MSQQPERWRIKNRLQFSYEFDDNIRESPSDTSEKIQDSSLRFLFHSRALRASQKTRIIFIYRGGLQTYFQNSIENKLINDIEARADFKVNKFTVGLRGSGRLKIFLNDILDYGTGAAELYFRLPPILKLGHEVALKTSGLTYQNFPAFDFSQNQIRWTISRRLGSRFSWRIALSTRQVKYERRAANFVPEDSSLVFLDFKQKDHNYKALLQLSYVKSFLINFNYSFQHNHSNSFGYDYYNHQIILILGFPFPRGIWLRGYGAIQIKNYSERFFPRFPTDIDTERQESNFFILDLSKDLNANLTVLLRFAYYNNESVIRSRFYQKKILSLGFDLRL
jgi:hypothetical protein